MPPTTDPKEGAVPVATAAGGRDGSPSGGSGQDAGQGDATISLTEHERLIKEERGRRAGQEKQHQRVYQKLEKDLEELKNQVRQGTLSSAADDDVPKELADLLDPNNPRDRIILDVARNQQKWARANAEEEARRRRDAALRAEVDKAVETVTEEWGVPETILDRATPEAVYRSAERWQHDEEVRKLTERQKGLEEEIKSVKEGAATVATRTRQELGATRVSTSTGAPPELPSAQQEEIQRLEDEKARAKREHRGADVIAINRQITAIRASA